MIKLKRTHIFENHFYIFKENDPSQMSVVFFVENYAYMSNLLTFTTKS